MQTEESGDKEVDMVEMTQDEFNQHMADAVNSMESLKRFCDESLVELSESLVEIEGEAVEIAKTLIHGQGTWSDRVELAKQKRKIESVIPIANMLMSIHASEGGNEYSREPIDEDLVKPLWDAFHRYCNSLVFE